MDQQSANELVAEAFARWYRLVARYAYYCCDSGALAEEFAQDAFLAYYQKLREGVHIQDPLAWLLRVVRNQVAKYWRAHRRHPVQSLATADGAELKSLPPIQSLDEGSDSVELYFAQLSPREREVVLLRCHGLKYHEIAARLGITPNSVGTLILRAVRKIRKVRGRQACNSWTEVLR